MLGKELRKAREAAGLTQEQLAHKTGIDRSYISELEGDKKSPTVNRFLRLCRAMNASAAAIISKIDGKRS